MRLGILTGGGDVPGLNPCIKAVVYKTIDSGSEIIGIRRGWGGMLNYNPDDRTSQERYILPLNKINTRTIDRTGGTFLHTSRTNPSKVKESEIPQFLQGKGVKEGDRYDFTKQVLKTLEHLKLDVLVTIGGDDTLSYSYRLHKEGFPVVAIPKTMDNDVYGTDYCIGFSTAVTRSMNFIDALRTVAGSHERIAVVELFGRYSGETSLISAYLSSVDRALIPEVPFDIDRLARFVKEDKKNNPSNYAIIAISEGATIVGGEIVETGEPDAYGNKKLGGIGQMTGQLIQQKTGLHVINQQVAYLMRSGEPDALDRMVATSFANLATDLALKKESGQMVALRDGKYTTFPIGNTKDHKKVVDVKELYDAENYRPKVAHVLGKPMFMY
jgi:ATP-dependent phosphofructokinase / diphosphate-dependent phosphofructokinase